MNLLNSILKVFVGDKAKKDIKEISPLVSKINSIEDEFIKLSNDELRSKTEKFKSEISNIKNPYQIKIDLINEKIENESSIDQKESFYNEIEGLENTYLDEIDKYLNDILPEAFCVVRETARRFTENNEIIVAANDYDIKLSSTKPYVKIESNKAIWINNWDAAGKNASFRALEEWLNSEVNIVPCRATLEWPPSD